VSNPFHYQEILRSIVGELKDLDDPGKIATYIPELAHIDPGKFGMHLNTVENNQYSAGDSGEKFSVQSISKVLSLTLALKLAGDEVWQRVGVEPSGNPFNSLVQLEYEKGKPRNPLINAGAIVICDMLLDCLEDPKAQLLEFVRDISGNLDIHYSQSVAMSEQQTGFRNYALTNLMKDFGNIHHDIDSVLDVYFHLCSLEMSCKELARTFLYLAAGGTDPVSNELIVTTKRAKRINAIMQMCGFYDEAGEFAFRTGLPGKSGVGGGIVAVHPGKFSVAVWSPKLNPKGNSWKGMRALEQLTTLTELSIF